MNLLNTSNPDCISWECDELLFIVLGGIRLEHLDRLRVTLKISYKHITIRHNLDLYNDGQLDKLIRKTAERFELGTVYMNKTIGDLINLLEAYRLEEIEKQAKPTEKKVVLTQKQEREARDFLSKAELLSRTNELIGQSGVIGENGNRLLMYLIFTSRKRGHPLHIVSLASSGMGKSYLQEKVSELIPEEDKIEITTLSENAFYYFGQQELKHRLLLIEDLDGAETVLYPLRELQSKKKINKTVAHKDTKGNTRTIHLTVEGPVSVAGCTTQESIYEDNANRSFLIYLDESAEQDERIMAYQRKKSAGTINIQLENETKELLKNTQRILQPISVRNPFAEHLQLPKDVFKPRRTNAHYLSFIEAITFYKQYQREVKTDDKGDPYIESTIEDIKEANALIKEILLRKSDELNTACRRHLEQIKAYLKSEGKTSFTTKDVRQSVRINHSNQKRYMIMLIQNHYIKQGNVSNTYEVLSYQEYEELKSRIDHILDDILDKLVVQSSKQVQSQNEPSKSKRISKKTL